MYVELKHINKHFGNFKASDDVSFGIEKGKLIGLLGQLLPGQMASSAPLIWKGSFIFLAKSSDTGSRKDFCLFLSSSLISSLSRRFFSALYVL